MSKSDKSAKPVAEKMAPRSVAPKKARPVKRRGVMGMIFSYLIVALIAVVAFTTYLHWDDILKYSGTRVCSYNVLGKNGTKAPNVPPIDLKKRETVEKTSKPAAPAPKVEKAETEDTAVVKSEKKDDLNERWQAARKMFWENDGNAAAAYEKLVEDYPGKTGLVGELGNVYYKNGDLDKAAEMFFKAGNQFKTAGKKQKAIEMVGVLKKLGTEKAKSFAQKLSTIVQ